MAERVARIRNSKIPYAVKHGEYVVGVEHVLEVFSSSGAIAFKNLRITAYQCLCVGVLTLGQDISHKDACHLSSVTGFVVSRANAKQSNRNCKTKFPYTCDHELVFLFNFCLLALYIIRTIPEMLSYRVINL